MHRIISTARPNKEQIPLTYQSKPQDHEAKDKLENGDKVDRSIYTLLLHPTVFPFRSFQYSSSEPADFSLRIHCVAALWFVMPRSPR